MRDGIARDRPREAGRAQVPAGRLSLSRRVNSREPESMPRAQMRPESERAAAGGCASDCASATPRWWKRHGAVPPIPQARGRQVLRTARKKTARLVWAQLQILFPEIHCADHREVLGEYQAGRP